MAAAEVDMAIGGDQGGSIRIPASCCGIVGLKPTHGLVPYTGAMVVHPQLDHLGPMTSTIADCACLLEVGIIFNSYGINTKHLSVSGIAKNIIV